MSLKVYLDTISRDLQFDIAIDFAERATKIWDIYAENSELRYQDSVVGLVHQVDKQLLSKTLTAIASGDRNTTSSWFGKKVNKLERLKDEFLEPKIALQDTDWMIPETVELSFYAVYNLLCFSLGTEFTIFGESTLYISINQSIDALGKSKILTFQEIQQLLDNNNCK